MLLPISETRSRPRLSSRPTTLRAKNGASYDAASGLTESPNPGRSIAITRWRAASAPTVGRNETFVAPRPWSSTTGGPAPACMVEIVPICVGTSMKRSVSASARPAVAARNPMPRCRSCRTASRPARNAAMPPPMSRAISAQVAPSASISASGRRPGSPGSSVAAPPCSTTSQVPIPVPVSRTRARPPPTEKISGSKRAASVLSARGAPVRGCVEVAACAMGRSAADVAIRPRRDDRGTTSSDDPGVRGGGHP